MAGTNASVTVTAADIFHEFSDATLATYTLRIDSGAKGQTSDISDLDLQVASVTMKIYGEYVTSDVAQLFAATVDVQSGAISYALSSSGKYVEYAGDYEDTLGQNHHIYLYVDKSMVDPSLWNTKVIFDGGSPILAPDASQLTVGLVHDSKSDTGYSANDGITKNTTPDLTGKAPAGTTVQIKLGAQTYGLGGDITPDAQGHWTFTVPNALANGTYSAQARLVDAVGNSSAWVNAAPFQVLNYTTSATENTKTVTTLGVTDALLGTAPKYSLTGADVSLFKISSKGALTFATAKDYEQPVDTNHDGIYEVSVTMTNAKTGYQVVKDLTVGVEFVPILGTASANDLKGTAGWDTLDGLAGDDKLTGGTGLDTFLVTAGRDAVMDFNLLTKDATGSEILQVSAGAVADATLKAAWTATSDSFNDGTANLITKGMAVDLSGITHGQGWNVTNSGAATTITGSRFNDVLTGGSGNDQLIGGAGNDVLIGGKGSDILTGGTGADTFRLSGDVKTDHINDFLSGTDRIELDHLLCKAMGTGQLAANQFAQGAAATTAAQRIVYEQPTGNLWYDLDGSGKGKAVLIAVLDNHVQIAHTDFWVI
jgi:Ca2+-binding RTX toxin-like protein